jgi:dipeptidyl aminopeptidase/acylaminoacyl peptidase
MPDDDASYSSLVFAPDSTRIVYARDDDLYITDLDTNITLRLTNTPDIREWFPQWSPNGEHLFFYWEDSADIVHLSVIDADRQNLRHLTPDWQDDVQSPHWSPDSTRLCFVTENEDGAEIFVVDITTGELRRVADSYPRFGTTRVEWSAEGDQLLVKWWTNNGGSSSVTFFTDYLDADTGELLGHEQGGRRVVFDYSPYDEDLALYQDQNRICIGRLDAAPVRCLDGIPMSQIMLWLP